MTPAPAGRAAHRLNTEFFEHAGEQAAILARADHGGHLALAPDAPLIALINLQAERQTVMPGTKNNRLLLIHLKQVRAVAIFITRRGSKVRIGLPAKTDGGAVKALVGTQQMEAAFKPELYRQFLRQRQTILQADHSETIGAVDGVLELIAAGHRGVLSEPRLDANGRLTARAGGREAVAHKVSDGNDGRRGQSLRKEEFRQGTELIGGAERRLVGISWIGIDGIGARKVHFAGHGHQIGIYRVVVQIVGKGAMIKTKVQLHSFANRFIEGGRQSEPAIIDVGRLVAFSGDSEMQPGVLTRLHFHRNFAATCAGRHGAAERI